MDATEKAAPTSEPGPKIEGRSPGSGEKDTTMTTATISGKRTQMSMEEKSHLLRVVDIHEQGTLAVVSNSDARVAYAVTHHNFRVTGCACTGCKVYGRTDCAYRRAAQRRLNEMKRDWYCQSFEIYA